MVAGRAWLSPVNTHPSFGTSAILPHAHPPQSKTIARLKANRPESERNTPVPAYDKMR